MTPAAEFPGFLSWLAQQRICKPAMRFAGGRDSILDAGEACPSAEWLLWAVQESGFRDAAAARKFSLACLDRIRDLLVQPGQREAVAILESIAAGNEPESAIATAEAWAAAASDRLTESIRWTVSAGAAAAALRHATAPGAWLAAAEVRTLTVRAVAWNPWDPATAEDTDRELAGPLKDALRPHAGRIVTAIRMRLAEMARLPPAEPCEGC
ncbi:MAG: hypothetical protein R2729_19350 [Bryobacteraceae bacterium]